MFQSKPATAADYIVVIYYCDPDNGDINIAVAYHDVSHGPAQFILGVSRSLLRRLRYLPLLLSFSPLPRSSYFVGKCVPGRCDHGGLDDYDFYLHTAFVLVAVTFVVTFVLASFVDRA